MDPTANGYKPYIEVSTPLNGTSVELVRFHSSGNRSVNQALEEQQGETGQSPLEYCWRFFGVWFAQERCFLPCPSSEQQATDNSGGSHDYCNQMQPAWELNFGVEQAE
ncbi:MAG: hypothetical protein WB543_14770 [Candidatus Acidiferrum sp.]